MRPAVPETEFFIAERNIFVSRPLCAFYKIIKRSERIKMDMRGVGECVHSAKIWNLNNNSRAGLRYPMRLAHCLWHVNNMHMTVRGWTGWLFLIEITR